MQSYDLSPQGPNWQALNAFIQAEEKRHVPGSSQGRVLLKLEGEGTNRHLVAIDETKLGILEFTLLRIKTLLTPSDYKLLNIKKFIDLIPSTQGEPFSRAKAIIDRKVEAPKNPSFFDKVIRVFDSFIHKSPSTTSPKKVVPYASELNEFLDSILRMQSGGPDQVTEFTKRFEHLQQVAIDHPELVDFIRDAKALYDEKIRQVVKPVEPPKIPGVELAPLAVQKDDGNCLLRAIAYGLDLPPDVSHTSLREQAALWLKHNWRTFQSDDIDLKSTILIQAIPDHNYAVQHEFDLFKQSVEAILQFPDIPEAERKEAEMNLARAAEDYNKRFIPNDLTDDARIEKYIELTRQDRMFCDNPHIIALSHLYNRPIIVYSVDVKNDGSISLVAKKGAGCNAGSGEPIELHFDEKSCHYNAVKSKPKPQVPPSSAGTVGKQPTPSPRKRKKGAKSPKKILPKVPKQTATSAPIDVDTVQAPTSLVAPIGCGMQNSGNSCFLNATVQAMRLNAPFRQFLSRQIQKASSEPKSPLNELQDLSTDKKLLVWNTMAEVKEMEVEYVKINKKDWTEQQKKQQFQELQVEKQQHIQERLGTQVTPELLAALLNLAGDRVDRSQALRSYLATTLAKLYDTMEGRNTRAQAADSKEVQALRRMCTFCGFVTRGDRTQEDASELMGIVLDMLNAPVFDIVPHYAYELAFPLPTIELEEIRGSFLKLEMAEAPQNTSLQGLISNNMYKTVINKQDILRTIQESDRLKVGEKEMRKIQALPEAEQSITALQSLHLKRDSIPDMLPITLSRFNRQDNRSAKVDTFIPVETSIVLSLDDDPSQDIEYKLTSVVVHTGSLDGGHYRCYGRHNIGGSEEWVEYDDSSVVIQNKHSDEVNLDIALNGYVFFFERVKKP